MNDVSSTQIADLAGGPARPKLHLFLGGLVNTLDQVESGYLRDDIPDFGPGDTVKVNVRVIEGGRERVQA